MKKYLRKISAVIAASAVIATAGISASAATADDVVAAARSAGFLEEYVQYLQNYLRVNKFTSSQYDILVDGIANAGSELDDVALANFGKTVAEMKGENTDPETGEVNDSFLNQIEEALKSEDYVNTIDHIISAGKEVGLDITVEKNSDKSFTVTVRDKDGNVQMIAPVGKLVDRTGVESENEEDNNFMVAAVVCSSVITAGGIGALILSIKNRKAGEE